MYMDYRDGHAKFWGYIDDEIISYFASRKVSSFIHEQSIFSVTPPT